MDNRTTSRLDIGIYIGIMAPLKVLIWDPCPMGEPVTLPVADIMSYAAKMPQNDVGSYLGLCIISYLS